MRYFIELSYDGTDFHGWQTQPNGITVQACLDKALTTCFRQDIISLGCGRTDAGVHATQFYAHFDVFDLPEVTVVNSVTNVNSLLPYTIAIKRIFAVTNEAHARFDAIARAYKYHLHFEKDPFKINKSWLYKGELDFEKMNEAAQLLLNFTDFSCFSKSKTQTFTNNCKITQAGFEKIDGGLIFTIKADRFLRNMVRAIVGTLILVGKGDIDVLEVTQIIESKSRSKAGQSVPACGLYLVAVEYPFIQSRKN
ncbi:tRNA pseudouridine(38-40) synthase TruA [Pedobacter boryungensis]|uniref:tRNA pseudouridine synthase A n=1 Tax=Pedobacter boryungensis TaxID=869962 RepID=A0ABX2DDR2_9SPHI|nr:tRNA pseudouridine(38-40) synthase TruA [Pedobacter boryungensis]NQX32237.1 tRNA pseudouridine(38-40) synthase TruA [Pedobacter boryungensis]